MMCVLTHLCLLLVLNLSTAKQTVLGSCRTDCGGISITYPFGVGKGCFFNEWYQGRRGPKAQQAGIKLLRAGPEWYEVTCNRSTSGELVPILSKINMEIVRISPPRPLSTYPENPFPLGSLRIKTKIASLGCSGGDDKDRKLLFDFRGSPFLISENNTLMVFGCNIIAALTHVKTIIVGCFLDCTDDTHFDSNYSECPGYQPCCNANVPKAVRDVIGVRIEEYDDTITNGGCGIAFLTDENDQWQSSPRPSNTTAQRLYAGKYGITELTWKLITRNLSFSGCNGNFENNPCRCDFDSCSTDKMMCACATGYEGNPYILNGCKDIDECKELVDGRAIVCPNGGACKNSPGSYRCEIKKSQTIIYVGTTIAFLAILLLIGSFIKQKIKHKKEIELRQKFFEQNGGGMLRHRLSESGPSSVDVKIFTEEALKKATDNYDESRILGEGGQGKVYKGVFSDNSVVAIKKARLGDSSQVEHFINEVLVLARINHRHVVKLLGCCLEAETPLLVYEYIASGTLFEHLHGSMFGSSLTWEHRLRIAVEVAGTLSYLHSSASTPIIHRDIKTANILLDDNLTAKVADFGASRIIPMDKEQLITLVQGTIGYLDPEYYNTGLLNQKSDIYSFGVLLMELISGQMPLCFERPQQSKHLVGYFASATKDNRLHEVIDGQMMNEGNQMEIQKAARIAVECTRVIGEERPEMKEVAAELEALRVKTTKHHWSGQNSEEIEHLLASHTLLEQGDTSSSGYESASRLYQGRTL